MSLRTGTVCLAKIWGFFLQFWQSTYVALWRAHSSIWSNSAVVSGSVFHIHCGTVVHNAYWCRGSTGVFRCTSTSVLQYAKRGEYGSWPEQFAQVRNPLTIFMASSAWPLLLGFLDALVVKFPLCGKLSR